METGNFTDDFGYEYGVRLNNVTVKKADIDKLLTDANKKLTSIVPSTGVSNEFVCFFECVDNRVDPTGVHVTNIII